MDKLIIIARYEGSNKFKIDESFDGQQVEEIVVKYDKTRISPKNKAGHFYLISVIKLKIKNGILYGQLVKSVAV